MVSLQIATALLAISGAGDTVLYDFSASWCGPCKQVEPLVDSLAAEGYPVQKVDFDREPALVKQYRISQVPTFVMVRNGQEVGRMSGGQVTRKELVDLMNRGAELVPAAPLASGAGSPATFAQPASVSQQLPPTATDLPVTAQLGIHSSGAGEDFTQKDGDPTLLQRMLEASVRIRITDPSGKSVGSGTVIDARAGEALILTCAHLFRDSEGKGEMTVDFFGAPDAPRGVPAQMIDFDLQNDVALISVRTKWAFTVARVAPRDYQPRSGDKVFSVGCNHGADPTIRESRINSLDRYAGGPNIQVAGKPVQGRSGGGLFTADGVIIGICNAADDQDNEGLYAGLPAVHAELNRMGLTYVYNAVAPGDKFRSPEQNTSMQVEMQEPPLVPVGPGVAAPPIASLPAAKPVGIGLDSALFNRSLTEPKTTDLSPQEKAALSMIEASSDEAEVVIIIRPTRDPQAKSEVILLDKASPEFRERLMTAGQSQR